MADCVFVLDANIFIQANRTYYAFDLVPAFWENLIRHAKNGRILSIDRIKQELDLGKDELAEWAKNKFYEWFVKTDGEDIQRAYSEIVKWVNLSNQFSQPAKVEFAQCADGWLVAYARARNCVVVTHEVESTTTKKKVPIPNICKHFGIRYTDTFGLLRELETCL